MKALAGNTVDKKKANLRQHFLVRMIWEWLDEATVPRDWEKNDDAQNQS